MRFRVWTAVLFAGCAAGCGGAARNESPGLSAEPTLPASCSALEDLPAAFPVDDFEDGDELLDPEAGLRGLWYVENDGTGEQEPPSGEREPRSLLATPGAPGSDRHALHTQGQGFRSWGAFVGVRLNAAQRGACTVDAAASSGLSFAARGSGAVRVNFGTPGTTPSTDGGECDADACSDFGAVVSLGDSFRPYELRFDELLQPPWAAPGEWEPARLVRLSFWAEEGDLDLWLDEVRFF
jgi:hypothetical protein